MGNISPPWYDESHYCTVARSIDWEIEICRENSYLAGMFQKIIDTAYSRSFLSPDELHATTTTICALYAHNVYSNIRDR